jgi:hypothetical protein
MALPGIGIGYQIGDGNVNEPQLVKFGNVQTATATATLTTAQILNGVLVGNPSTSAASYTIPTSAQLDAVLNTPSVGSSFELKVVNLGTSSGVITFVANTGITLVGLNTVAIAGAVGSSAQFVFTKMADTTYTAYRVA